MKRLVQLCIRFGFLPRYRWFHRIVLRELWRPASERDAGMVSGWLELGPNTSWQAANRFRDWWYTVETPPETAGDRQK